MLSTFDDKVLQRWCLPNVQWKMFHVCLERENIINLTHMKRLSGYYYVKEMGKPIHVYMAMYA